MDDEEPVEGLNGGVGGAGKGVRMRVDHKPSEDCITYALCINSQMA